jgi:hypothetical protein
MINSDFTIESGAIQIPPAYLKLPILQKVFMSAGMKFLRSATFATISKDTH